MEVDGCAIKPLFYEGYNLDFNITITGGLGFIGANIIYYLLNEGVKPGNIRVVTLSEETNINFLDRFDTAFESNSNWGGNNIGLYLTDIGNGEGLDKQLSGSDFVIHLAAHTSVTDSITTPEKDFYSNTVGTFNIVQASLRQQVKHLIYTSSVAGFAQNSIPVHESSLPNPISPYGASKLSGEFILNAWAHTYDLQCTIVRLTNVYGILFNNNDGLISRMMRKALSGETLEIFGDGTATRDFLNSQDVCRAVGAILMKSKWQSKCNLFQISSGEVVSVNTAVEVLNDILIENKLSVLKFKHLPARIGEINESCALNDHALNELGWAPEINLSSGLDDTLKWYLDTNKN